MKKNTLCVTLLYLSIVVPLGLKAQSASENSNIENLVREIQNAPAWAHMSRANFEVEGPKLMSALSQVKGMKVEEVRQVVEALGNNLDEKKYHTSEWSKIFILNRLYFNVPPTQNIKDMKKGFGGFVLPAFREGTIDTLFPLARNKGGNLKIAAPFLGYMGPPYNYKAEFDSFSKRYGVRPEAQY